MIGFELWHLSSKDTEIREAPVRGPNEGEVLVRALFSLISTGTERIISKGMVPPNLMEEIRVPYMKGEFTFPCTYGYSLVGEIVEGPAGHIGKKVHLMHPHQSFAVTMFEDINFIPDGISLKAATLASNIETALTGVWDSRVTIGDEVLLVGFGIIGALLSRLLFNFPNVKLTVIENDEQRLLKAKELGFHVVRDSGELNRNYDIAFNCSGTQEGLQLCIDCLTFEGRVVEISWYGNQRISLHLGQEFHIKRNQIISSQVSHIPGRKMSKWDFERRKQLVFDILKDPYYQKIIDDEISFHDAPLFFKRIRNNQVKNLGTLITY